MNLAAIRAGLVTNVTAVVTDAEMNGYLLTPVQAPGFEVELATMNYDATYGRGTDELDVVVRGYLPVNEPVESEKRRDNWIDGTEGESIKAAIESDKTLGGACDSLRVTGATARTVIVDNATYLCAEFNVHILGDPT